MSKNLPFIDPYITLYMFFSLKHGKNVAYQWGHVLASQLGVRLHDVDNPPLNSDENVCFIYPQHDAWVVYASVDKKGDCPKSVWGVLSDILFGHQDFEETLSKGALWRRWTTRTKSFWGMSLFFGAEIESLQEEDDWLETIFPLYNFSESNCLTSLQKWGLIWQITDLLNLEQKPIHIYAVLALKEYAKEAEDILINQIDIVELSLHKSYQQLEHYEAHRKTLYDLLDYLDRQLEELIEAEQPRRDVLTAFSKEHFEFSKLSSNTLELQNTVDINRKNYHRTAKELGLFGTQDEIFSAHSKQLRTGYDQLQADQIYYKAALQRFETGLQAVRANLELLLVEQEQTDAKRDKQRDSILALIGLLLGVAQLWPIADTVLDLLNPNSLDSWQVMRLGINVACLNGVVILLALLIGLGVYSWVRRE